MIWHLPSSTSKNKKSNNNSRSLKTAKYILEVLYPNSQDPKLFLVILHHLRQILITLPSPTTKSNNNQHLTVQKELKEIKKILQEHKTSPIELKTKKKFIIFNNNYKKQSILTFKQLQERINKVEKIVQKENISQNQKILRKHQK